MKTRTMIGILCWMAFGCSKSSSEPHPKPLDFAKGNAGAPQASHQEFHFGRVLARGQTLRHDFSIRNPEGRAVRIINAISMTPCCSSVDDAPREIPALSVAKIGVVYKPGLQTGTKGVMFLIETAGASTRRYSLMLSADLFSEWEVIPSEDNPKSLLLGSSGTLRFAAVSRRVDDSGLPPPDSVDLDESLILRSFGPPIESSRDGDFVEARRDLEVGIRPAGRLGWNGGRARFGWQSGEGREYAFAVEVRPHLQVAPSAIVVRKDESAREHHILVSSVDKPFRILDVRCPLLDGPQPETVGGGRSQALTLKVDPSRQGGHVGSMEAVIRTDHPDQPTVAVKILVLDESGGREVVP